MRSVQSVVGVVALAVLGAGLSVPAPAMAAAAPPSPAAVPYGPANETAVGTDGPALLAVAGSRVFVADRNGDRVLVFDRNGAPVATIGSQEGPASITPSSDGTAVYVALRDASAISIIDVASASESGRVAVAACPTHTALSSGRLFYSHGCESGSGVASIDPATAAAPVNAIAGSAPITVLAGTSTHLVLGVDSNVDTISTYATAADGSATPVAQLSPSQSDSPRDFAVSPDGSRITVAAYTPTERVQSLTLPGLQPARAYVGDLDPRGVAISPDGSRLVVGAGYSDIIRMYDAKTGAMLWHRYSAIGHSGFSWGPTQREVLPKAVAFSTDGSLVYALTRAADGGDVRLFRSAVAPVTPKPVVTVKTSFGRPTTVTVSVPGLSAGNVQLFLRNTNGAEMLGTTTAITNGQGRRSIGSQELGAVSAYFLGDVGLMAAASPAVQLKPASRMTVAMAGTSRLVKGVRTYASHKDVRVRIRLEPQRATTVLVTLWVWRKGKWVTDGYTKQRTDSNGKLVLIFPARVKGKLSFTAYFKGNGRVGESGAGGAVFSMAK